MYSAVIFDLDGLILDTEAIARLSWRRTMVDFGSELEDEIYERIIGRTVPDIKDILQDAYGESFPIEEIFQKAYQFYNNYIEERGIPVKPGVSEMLAFLDKVKLPRAVATSSNRDFAIKKLTIANLVDRFDIIVGGDNIQNGKPAPDIFLEAAKQLQTEPGKCLAFEDSDNGVRAAYQAGMKTIMIPDLRQPPQDVVRMAYKISPSFYEVIPFLETAINRPA